MIQRARGVAREPLHEVPKHRRRREGSRIVNSHRDTSRARDGFFVRSPMKNASIIFATMTPGLVLDRSLRMNQPRFDPRAGIVRRHHISDSAVQQAVKQAAKATRIHKPVSVLPSSTPTVVSG